jgi:hypothetical protein
MPPRSITLGDRGIGTLQSRAECQNSNFQQQGSWDWTETLKLVVMVPFGILQRLSSAGIDGGTVIAAEYLGRTIEWNTEGRIQFHDALSSVKYIGAFNSRTLYFGFGINHITNILYHTDEGARVMAMCACLTECYEERYAASVMLEWTKILAGGESNIPSYQQWLGVIGACAGILARSSFATLVEDFMGLDDYDHVAGGVGSRPTKSGKHNGPGKRIPSRGITKPEAMAHALIGICKTAAGDIEKMTISGGADAAFVAAIANSFLGLGVLFKSSVTAIDLPGGNFCDEAQLPRVVVLLNQMCDFGAGEEKNKQLQLFEKVHRLDDATVFIRETFGQSSTAMVAGRVKWDKALSISFRQDFRDLLKTHTGENQKFAKAIGYAARIFQGVVQADEDAPEQWLRYCRLYFPESWGQGYVFFAQERFPELKCLHGVMAEAAEEPSFQVAMDGYIGALGALAERCGCRTCGSRDNVKDRQRAFCLVALTESIIRTIRYLAGVETDQDLCLHRGGLELMYREHVIRMRNLEMGRRAWSEHWGKRQPANRIVEHVYPDDGEPVLMAMAEVLYSGGRYQNNNQNLTGGRNALRPRLVEGQHISAIKSQGLCYFLGILKDPRQDLSSLARVHIIQGTIEWNNRQFDYVCDGPSHKARDPSRFKSSPPKIFIPQSLLSDLNNAISRQLRLFVQDQTSVVSTNGLQVEYGIVSETLGRASRTIGPAKAIESVGRFSGLVRCSQKLRTCSGSDELDELVKNATTELKARQAYSVVDFHGSKIYITRAELPIALLTASGAYESIVQRGDCLACCIRAGSSKGWENFAVVQTDPSQWSFSSIYPEHGDNVLAIEDHVEIEEIFDEDERVGDGESEPEVE